MESVLFTIREKQPYFSNTERKIASVILEEAKSILLLTVAQLAEKVGTSQAAIVRFCKKIGVASYSEFKLRLSHDVFRTTEVPFLPDVELTKESDPKEIVKGIIRNFQQTLSHLEALIDLPKLTQAVSLIEKARAVYVFGIGASGLVAMDVYQKLIRIGLLCVFSADTDMQVTTSCTVQPKDVVFIISYSGETPSMIAVAENAKRQGASIITLTRNDTNTLRKMANVDLVVPVTEGIYRSGAILSRITQLALVDMLYSLLIVEDMDAARARIERTMEAIHIDIR
ncbi:MAG: MurR/RpiR family transcriptional regulator [Spirochaetales bacterium]